MLKEKYILMTEEEITRTLRRLAAEVAEKIEDLENTVIVGIKTRGVPIAERIKEYMKKDHNVEVKTGSIDITFYRDDLSLINESPVVKQTELDFDINDKIIVLCDDVLYTGRTVRAALDELMDFGRPRMVKLLVLVDRGHRELPICADFIGKTVTTTKREVVKVKFDETDGKTEVVMCEKEEE